MAQSSSPSPSTNKSFWEKTKSWSGTAYTKAKPGFDKVYSVVDKLGAPVNRLSNKVGSEAFWPTTLDKESEKCARILRVFCKDGFYEKLDGDSDKAKSEGSQTSKENTPQGQQRNIVKIPQKVIENAVGLAIFTTMRTGWLFGGSGGAGVVVARHPETRAWSSPSGIMTQNFSVGFLAGVDIYDTVLVINSYRALEAFTRLRCTLGSEVGVAAGPVGFGGELDMEIHKRPAPVWSYVKSRGLYAGVALTGNAVIERSDENERFYGEKISVADILAGKASNPPIDQYKTLMATLQAAQGDEVDESLLPSGDSPADMEIENTYSFGIPAEDDDDPYGVKALEAEGLHIREAGSHQRPSAEVFEFNPAPSSPIYGNFRKSIDFAAKRRTASWRNSTNSLASVDRGTQTAEDETGSSRNGSPKPVLPPRPASILKAQETEEPTTINEQPATNETKNPIHEASQMEKEAEHDDVSIESDIDSDIDSEAEIVTAVVTTQPQARVVTVPKAKPPVLPARNPGRAIQPTNTTSMFTVKLRTEQAKQRHDVALRTSKDNWTIDRKGEYKDGIWQIQLDPTVFTEEFECKFVVLPDRWMHDPNLLISNPTANGSIEFTDDRVVFPPPTHPEMDELDTKLEHVSLSTNDDIHGPSSVTEEDHFVSVPPSPSLEKDKVAT